MEGKWSEKKQSPKTLGPFLPISGTLFLSEHQNSKCSRYPFLQLFLGPTWLQAPSFTIILFIIIIIYYTIWLNTRLLHPQPLNQRVARCCWACDKYLCKPYLDQLLLLFFLQMIFFLMLMKEYVFCFYEFPTFSETQKRKTTYPLPVIYKLDTCWAKPNDHSHFGWPITIGEGSFCLYEHSSIVCFKTVFAPSSAVPCSPLDMAGPLQAAFSHPKWVSRTLVLKNVRKGSQT